MPWAPITFSLDICITTCADTCKKLPRIITFPFLQLFEAAQVLHLIKILAPIILVGEINLSALQRRRVKKARQDFFFLRLREIDCCMCAYYKFGRVAMCLWASAAAAAAVFFFKVSGRGQRPPHCLGCVCNAESTDTAPTAINHFFQFLICWSVRLKELIVANIVLCRDQRRIQESYWRIQFNTPFFVILHQKFYLASVSAE